MPIYEYSCDQCKKVFEEWVRHIDDNVAQTCPECGAQAQRIVSNTSFVLKGGGWYVTDYGYRKGKDEKSASSASSGSSTPVSSTPATPAAPAASATAPAPAASSAPAAGSGGAVSAA